MITDNPDESWDFLTAKFSKSLINSVKIRIQNFKILFIFVIKGNYLILNNIENHKTNYKIDDL